MSLLADNDFLSRMRKGWVGGLGDGTPCGRGSTLQNTTNIRKNLIRIVKDYRIKSICDAGAGDLHWILDCSLKINYYAYDIVPRHPKVKLWDITEIKLPECDLILCRMTLNHLPPDKVIATVDLLKQSGKYLLATSHSGENKMIKADYNDWNLEVAPFNLGNPLERIEDTVGDCCLWRLHD